MFQSELANARLRILALIKFPKRVNKRSNLHSKVIKMQHLHILYILLEFSRIARSLHFRRTATSDTSFESWLSKNSNVLLYTRIDGHYWLLEKKNCNILKVGILSMKQYDYSNDSCTIRK